MFEIGQAVLYGMEGVCTIEDRQKMKVGHSRAFYFVLRPVFRPNSTIFVPEENAALLSKMRPILTREEIMQVLHDAPEEDLAWIEDPNERKTEYQQILNGGDRLQMLRMVHVLLQHRKKLLRFGKHLRSADDQMLREAQKLLHDEFALVLDIAQDKISDYIRAQTERSA